MIRSFLSDIAQFKSSGLNNSLKIVKKSPVKVENSSRKIENHTLSLLKQHKTIVNQKA